MFSQINGQEQQQQRERLSTAPPETGVHSRCLDAFVVALGQVYHAGEDRRWYTSTLELQLASLDFCRACRNVPTLRMRVGEGTPSSLLNVLAEEQQKHPASSHQDRGSSRLPPVPANRVKRVVSWINDMRKWRGVE
ncbi:unnamed protein product, partial [Ectocarpus sp. 12 AP-2014]